MAILLVMYLKTLFKRDVLFTVNTTLLEIVNGIKKVFIQAGIKHDT